MADTADGPSWDLARYGEQIRALYDERPAIYPDDCARGDGLKRAYLRPAATTDGFIEWTFRTDDEDAA
jgi:hypothetical protein